MAAYALEAEHQTSRDPVLAGGFGGNITQPVHFNIKKVFAGKQFDTDHYRLQLKNLAMIQGQLQEVDIPCHERGVEPLSLPGWPAGNIRLTEEQQLGSDRFSLCKDEWLPLPGLSARDQLVHLRCRENFPLALARGNETGQLLVKLAENAPGNSHEATLDFIITPDQAGLEPLKPGDDIQVCDDLCDSVIRERLDGDVFSPKSAIHSACYELQILRDKPDKCQQLLGLARWCKEFGDTRDVPGSGLNLLVNLIRKKQGVCRHRCQVFQVLSQYFGVPARMVRNDAHQYVEISPDGGRHWRRVDLGGGGQCTWTEQAPDFPPGITPAPLLQEAVLPERDKLSNLYKQCVQGSNPAGAWQQLQDFLTSPYIKNRYTVLCSFRECAF